jgi:hypothetical protein
MKKLTKKTFVMGLLVMMVLSVLPFSPLPAEAAVSNWQQGASIFSVSQTDFASDNFKQSLRNLRDTGASSVALVIPVHQATKNSADIYSSWDTPTDDALRSAINYAHSLGLQVMLKPHLTSDDGTPWRAWIDASDRDRWFASYSAMLNHLGDIATETGAEGICIGTELITMATYTSNGDNTQRWQTLISTLRSHFSGFLTYSANWGGDFFAEEAAHIGFWGSLNYIGLSGYYPLSTDQWDPSVESLVGSWSHWDNTKVKPLSDQFGKSVIFTEIGYRSVDNANRDPWDGGRGGNVNLNLQSKLYEAFFQYWNNKSYVQGAYLWDWELNPNGGGSGNNHYTPQNKPAQQIMTTWFSGSGTPTPPPSGGTTTPPSGTPAGEQGDWTVTAGVTGNQTGSPVSIAVNVMHTGNISNAIADIEVYDASNNKVHQQFFENQTFDSQTRIFNTSWTPSSQGTYTVKFGAFNNNWSTNYHWNNAVTTIAVGSGGTTQPPDNNTGGNTGNNPSTGSGQATNIWWPTDGVSVNGVQPLKYNVEGLDASAFTGYWQVDGDRLNEMQTSTQDYPHKEVLVDFTGWNWKGQGPYIINFVSKNSSGETLSQKAINLFVR